MLAVLIGGVLIVGGLLAARLSRLGSVLGEASPDLDPLQRVALTGYLALYADELWQPAGAEATPVDFTVAPGETADEVAQRLAEQNLVNDAQLLRLYLRYTGRDARIEAGDFILRRTMTIPEVGRALAEATAREIAVRIPEGWRLEEIGQRLADESNLAITLDEWLAATGPNSPRLGAYSFYGDLPPGAALEGFVYPDTYLVHPGATVNDVLAKALANFEKQITPQFRAALNARQLSLYQAVIIASLIEREAAVEDERPLIASVILNRLAVRQPLQIDAALQYALGSPENWWPPVAGLDLYAIESPYNTYKYATLPPSPIANVRASSLQAVANPAQTNYYYYRAACDGSGRHNFAQTYDEHLANACP